MSNKDMSKALVDLLSKAAPEDFEKIVLGFVADLTSQLKSEADAIIKKLTAERDAALKSVSGLTAERDTALSTITDLSEQIAAQSKITESGKKIVTIGKEKYFLEGGPFTIPGKGTVSAEDLAKDEEYLKMLVKKESGILRKVDK